MFIRNELKEFMEQMEVIMVGKYPKYKDTWRTVPINVLRKKMNDHVEAISTIIMSGVDWDKKRVRREFAHVANYCCLIRIRILEMLEETK